MNILGEAKKCQGKYIGTYILQTDLINSYPTWKHKIKKSVWFSSAIGRWVVGYDRDIGSSTCEILGPIAQDDWPPNINGNWKFGVGGRNWIDALERDITFLDFSNGMF